MYDLDRKKNSHLFKLLRIIREEIKLIRITLSLSLSHCLFYQGLQPTVFKAVDSRPARSARRVKKSFFKTSASSCVCHNGFTLLFRLLIFHPVLLADEHKSTKSTHSANFYIKLRKCEIHFIKAWNIHSRGEKIKLSGWSTRKVTFVNDGCSCSCFAACTFSTRPVRYFSRKFGP